MDLDLSRASEAQNEGKPISLSLFSLINQARNEHGMRQQDFHRYRTFCSTKVHRLREAMNKTHVEKAADHQQGKKKKEQNKKILSKKQKLKAQSAAVQSANSKGKGHVFVRKSIAVQDIDSDRPAQLLLFEAERAWAYSQELKQEAFDKEQDSVIRKHGLNRSRRGVQWSKSLLDLISALGSKRVDVMTRAEVTAYHTLLRGYESFDKDSHKSCVEQLSVTRKLLYAIADASNDSRKEALANSYVDSTEAMLRFCGYNLGLSEQDMDALAKQQATPEVCEKIVPGLQSLIEELQAKKQAETGGKEVKKLVSVKWHSQDIAIRNPELVDVILRVEGEEDKLRASLKSKGENSVKAEVAKDHKRQRLSSAQRSAKKRGHGVSVASTSKPATASTSKTLTTSSKTELDGYDSLLAALTEAEDTARRLVSDNAEALAKSHSSRYEAAGTDLINAHEYLLYKLLSVRIERNAKLIGEVEEKGEGRQRRVQEAADRKVQALSSGPKARREGAQPVRRKVKPEKKKVRPAGAKKQKKARVAATSASRTPRTKKTPPKKKQMEDRLRRQALLKVQRISVRSVPGVAKLLDSCEMSCSGISTLGLVESDANVSTLMEAKSAWYKSELLRVLAKSYAWNGEEDKSLLLLNRSELFIREARSAMELVEEGEVERENGDVYPVMSEVTFAKSEELIERFRRKVQRDLLLKHRNGAVAKSNGRSTLSQSKANVAINDMAVKYVDFDPVDLQQASQISSQREAQLLKEANGSGEEDEDAEDWKEAEIGEETDGPHRERQISLATTTFSDDFDDRLVGKSNDTGGAYDPANLIEDDEYEDAAESAANQKSRWLGGWFARK